MGQDSFPRLAARTKNFTLGLPRNFVVSPDGRRVLFLRSSSGTSTAQSLWLYDVTRRTERVLAEPARLLEETEERLTAEERARRERMRVRGSGVVAFTTDKEVRRAAFALSSRLFLIDVVDGDAPRELATDVVGGRPVPRPHGASRGLCG